MYVEYIVSLFKEIRFITFSYTFKLTSTYFDIQILKYVVVIQIKVIGTDII